MKISIIIPALNEAKGILDTLESLQALREIGHEIILVDGGSDDATVEISRSYVDKIVSSGKGRARQMNAGADQSSSEILWFVHADTLVPGNAGQLIQDVYDSNPQGWGRFDVQITGSSPLLLLVSYCMNMRSRLTSIATGDQGIFLHRSLYDACNGFADIPLMEDIEFSSRLRAISKPHCIKQPLVTSGRRWQQRGVIRTILLMWSLRFAYFIGVPATRLARMYA